MVGFRDFDGVGIAPVSNKMAVKVCLHTSKPYKVLLVSCVTVCETHFRDRIILDNLMIQLILSFVMLKQWFVLYVHDSVEILYSDWKFSFQNSKPIFLSMGQKKL